MSANPSASSGGAGTSVPVLRIPTNKARVVCFLGPLLGSIQHWVKGRTVPCLDEDCPGAVHLCPIRYFAYAPVLVYDSPSSLWEAQVVQATANLEEQLRGRKVRGEVWSLSRAQHKHDRGPIVGKYLSQFAEEQMIPSFDVIPSLQRVFGVKYIPLGADNPFPNRLVIAPVAIDVLTAIEGATPTAPPAADKVSLNEFLSHLKSKEKKGQ